MQWHQGSVCRDISRSVLAAKDELGINCAQVCRTSETSVTIETEEDTYLNTDFPVNEYVIPNEEDGKEDEKNENEQPVVKEEPKKSWMEGIKIFWRGVGEKLDTIRNEQV